MILTRRGNKVISVFLIVLAVLLAFTACQPNTNTDKKPMEEQEKADVARYITAFTTSNIIADINSELDKTDVKGLEIIDSSYNSAKGSVEIVVDLDEYAIDSFNVSGEVTFRFTADTPSTNATSFASTDYSIDCKSFDVVDGEESYAIRLSGISGVFTGTFTVSGDSVTALPAVALGTPTDGTVQIAGKDAIKITEIIDYGDLDEDSVAVIAGIYKAVATDVANKGETITDGKATYTGYSVAYVYTPTVTDGKVSAWTLEINADRTTASASSIARAANEHDISFTVKDTDATNIDVYFDGIRYSVAVSEIKTDSPAPGSEYNTFKWDITVRVAAHNGKGSFDDKDNWKHVGKEITENPENIFTIEIEENSMTAFLSTDESQRGEDEKTSYKWFALLIGTGENDLTKITYGTSPLTDKDIADRNAMVGAYETGDAANPASDEFVLWLKAEDLSEGNSDIGYPKFTKEITLKHDNAEDIKITLNIQDKPGIVIDDDGTIVDDPEEMQDPNESKNPNEDTTGETSTEDKSDITGSNIPKGEGTDDKNSTPVGGESGENGEGTIEFEPVG